MYYSITASFLRIIGVVGEHLKLVGASHSTKERQLVEETILVLTLHGKERT
jgi:hypothetical protein